MTEEDERLQILRTILDDPTDTTARLVFADWLDEHPLPPNECLGCKGTGGIEDAYVFVDPSRYDDYLEQNWYVVSNSWTKGQSTTTNLKMVCRCILCGGRGSTPDERRAKHAELIRLQLKGKMSTEDKANVARIITSQSFKNYLIKPLGAEFLFTQESYWTTPINALMFTGGFVERVTCSLQTWETHGHEIVATQPVTYVDVYDRTPVELVGLYPSKYQWQWHENDAEPGNPGALPHRVWRRTVNRHSSFWPSIEEAREDLSSTLIEMAKERNSNDE